MRPCSAVLLTPLECAVPGRIPISIQSAPGNPLESALTSHSQTVENTATLSLLECALTRLSPATPLESALTKNRAGGGSLFWFRSSPLTMCRSPQYSSSFFSHSCALFCALLHAAKNQVLSFQSIPHSFAKNHPGVALLSPARSVLRGGGGVHRPSLHFSRLLGLRRQTRPSRKSQSRFSPVSTFRCRSKISVSSGLSTSSRTSSICLPRQEC